MKSSWPWVALVAAGVVVVLVFVVLPQRRGNVAGPSATATEQAERSGRVQQRLREIAETGGQTGEPSSSEKLTARSHVPAVPERGMLRPRAAAPGAEGRAEAGAGGGEANTAEMAQPGPNPQPLDMDPDDIPALSNAALHDADADRREAAVTLLGAADDPQVIPVLAQALADPDEDVRMAAVQSLSDFTGEAPFDAVESALNDPSADIRYEALEVLADLDEQRAQPFLQRALSDPDDEVQSLAESLLDVQANQGATPAAPPPPQAPQNAAR